MFLIECRLRRCRDGLAGAIDQFVENILLGRKVVVDGLAPKTKLNRDIIEVRFTKTVVGKQLLCSLQYLLTPVDGALGRTGVGCRIVSKGAFGATSVACSHPSPFASVDTDHDSTCEQASNWSCGTVSNAAEVRVSRRTPKKLARAYSSSASSTDRAAVGQLATISRTSA
jgi:hypothetical protein